MRLNIGIILFLHCLLLNHCYDKDIINQTPSTSQPTTGLPLHIDSPNDEMTSIQTTPSIVDNINKIKAFIAKICNRTGLFGTNCTCEKLNLISPISIKLCKILDSLERNITSNETHISIFICKRTSNIIEASFSLIASLIGIFGNGIVIIVSFINWSRFRHCQQLIGFLAFSDLIYSIVNLIIRLPLFWDCRWPFGFVMCRVIHGISDVSGYMALGFIVIISVERYFGVVKPFSRGLTSTKMFSLSALNAVAAIITAVPVITVRYITENGLCGEDWQVEHGQLIYDWYLAVFYFILPLFIILCLYYKIMQKLRIALNETNSSMLDFENRQKRLQDNKRIMVILATVVFAFFILIVPSRIGLLIIDHVGANELSDSAWSTVQLALYLPYYFHVICNPIIYSLVDKRFRKEALKLLKCNVNKLGIQSSQVMEMKSCRTSRISMSVSKASFSVGRSPTTRTSPGVNRMSVSTTINE